MMCDDCQEKDECSNLQRLIALYGLELALMRKLAEVQAAIIVSGGTPTDMPRPSEAVANVKATVSAGVCGHA